MGRCTMGGDGGEEVRSGRELGRSPRDAIVVMKTDDNVRVGRLPAKGTHQDRLTMQSRSIHFLMSSPA